MFKEHKSNTKSLQPGDSGFHMVDGNLLVPRAMLGIKHDCPTSVRETLNYALERGWVVPIAHIYEHEEIFNLLADKS